MGVVVVKELLSSVERVTYADTPVVVITEGHAWYKDWIAC